MRETIKTQIRESLSKRLKEAARTKWDPDRYPNISGIDTFLRKSGYRLIDVLEVDNSSAKHPVELVIESIEDDHLHPEIQQDTLEGIFQVNVKEYGFLDMSDVEEIVKGLNNSISLLKHLNSLKLNKILEEITN